ncbi:hypothetical protein D9M68_783330 [compost metagenome]
MISTPTVPEPSQLAMASMAERPGRPKTLRNTLRTRVPQNSIRPKSVGNGRISPATRKKVISTGARSFSTTPPVLAFQIHSGPNCQKVMAANTAPSTRRPSHSGRRLNISSSAGRAVIHLGLSRLANRPRAAENSSRPVAIAGNQALSPAFRASAITPRPMVTLPS